MAMPRPKGKPFKIADRILKQKGEKLPKASKEKPLKPDKVIELQH